MGRRPISLPSDRSLPPVVGCLLEGQGHLAGFSWLLSPLVAALVSGGFLCPGPMAGLSQKSLCPGPPVLSCLCTAHAGMDLPFAGKGPCKSCCRHVLFVRTAAFSRVIFGNSRSDPTSVKSHPVNMLWPSGQRLSFQLCSLEPPTPTFYLLLILSLVCLPGPRPSVLRAGVLFSGYC